MTINQLLKDNQQLSFNPYYVGYCTMTPALEGYLLISLLFQSLLCWILYYDVTY